MNSLRIIVCFALAVFLMSICAQAIQMEELAIRLGDPTDNDRLYMYAKNFFEDNEYVIREAVEKALSSGMERICIRYHRAEQKNDKEYYVSDEVWVYNEINDEDIELFDTEYLNLANCSGDFRIMTLRLCDNGVAVDFEDYHDYIDFLRTHRFGYYYIPGGTDESIAIEDILAKCMPDEWSYQTKTADDYQVVRISNDFVYYHWHG